MAEQISALHTHLKQGHFGLEVQTGVTLEEISDFSLIQIAAWPETLRLAGAEAVKATGSATAPGPGQSVTGESASLLRIEPLKWWLLSEQPLDQKPVLGAETGAVLDLSSARTWVRVGGREATVLLNHFLPLDLRDEAFPSGHVASTALHHVGITLWRQDETFNLFLPRSFAATLWELLTESAHQYGLKIQ